LKKREISRVTMATGAAAITAGNKQGSGNRKPQIGQTSGSNPMQTNNQ